jgi:hypothetical protein
MSRYTLLRITTVVILNPHTMVGCYPAATSG